MILHKKTSIENLLFYTGFLVEFFIVFFTTQKNEAFVSILFLITFIWLLAYFAIYVASSKVKSNLNKVLLALCVLSLLTVIVFGSQLSFDYFKKVIMFIYFLVFAKICNETYITRKDFFYLIAINALLALVYINIFRTGGFEVYEGALALTLNFGNPNMTGLFLHNTLIYLLIFLFYYWTRKSNGFFKRIVICLFTLGLIIVLAVFLYFTQCRSALLAVFFFVGLVVCDMILGYKIPSNRAIVFLWSIIPIIFFFYYMEVEGLLDFNTSFGYNEASKSSSTRMDVWGPAYDILKENLIFGNYDKISEGTGMSQMHNTHIDVWLSYGIVPLFLFISYLNRIVNNSFKNTTDAICRYGVYGFMANFISGTFEAILVAGGSGLYILVCGFLLIANMRE